ncbi:MAG: hypothetical protein WCO79_02510 [bacterium]
MKIVEDFYVLDPGVTINDPSGFIYFSDAVRISRRGLKHVIEMRKDDKYSILRIQQMCSRVLEVFLRPDMCIKNPNQTYAESYVSGKLYESEKEALLVVHYCMDGANIDIVTMFYRSEQRFKKMRDKK